jgi:hypothetical protein
MPLWKVSDVKSIREGIGRDLLTWGFNITRENGRPLASFMYETSEEAEKSAKLAKSIIRKAILVRSYA